MTYDYARLAKIKCFLFDMDGTLWDSAKTVAQAWTDILHRVEGIDRVVAASAFRDATFGRDYGVGMVGGPLKGLLARAVVVLDREGRVVYAQLVPEITEEPDYAAAVAAVKGL